MAHKVRMLGTGNAFLPNGRLHSLVMIDDKHLVDAPPTALISLRNIGIPVNSIETIFITHLHGDHIFGLPFLLLERQYISDREGKYPLTIVAAKGAKERIIELCNIAYPGTLERFMPSINWCEDDSGQTADGWSWERFRVHHDDAVDPFGFRFESTQGASLVHSGDSGPCDNLYNAIERSQLSVVEMGFPEWVDSDHHHKPSDIQKLAMTNPSKTLVITHTFIDDAKSKFPTITESKFPDHPPNVHHASDGDCFMWENGKWTK
jgi:ribonuclease BN (tRNA processing enzyme)